MERNLDLIREELLEVLKKKNYLKIKDIFNNYAPIDIAESLRDIDEDDADIIKSIIPIFRLVKPSITSEFFSELEPAFQEKIISSLNNEEVASLVHESSNDELADFIEEWPANVVDKVLKNASKDQRNDINKLLGYRDDTAGSIMTTEYITLLDSYTVAQAFQIIRSIGRTAETIYTLFIKNKKFDLVGVLNLDDLVFAEPDQNIIDIANKNFLTVNVNTDQEEVAQLFKRYDLNAIAVLNEDKKLTGIITIDDIVDVIEAENSEDIEAMANVAPLDDSYMNTPVFRLAFKCIPWLIVLMILNIGSIFLQDQFQFLIGTLTAISVFLTTLCDTGGNSGSQSSTLIIRGLATKDFELKDYFKVLWKEFRVALIVSIITAVFTFGFCMFMFGVNIINIPSEFKPIAGGEPEYLVWITLSGTVTISIFVTILLSKIIGASLPFLISKIKLDPAVVTGPLITTIMDLITLTTYFLLLWGSFQIFWGNYF